MPETPSCRQNIMRSLERTVIAARDSSPFWAETRIKNFLCEERNAIAGLYNDAERLQSPETLHLIQKRSSADTPFYIHGSSPSLRTYWRGGLVTVLCRSSDHLM